MKRADQQRGAGSGPWPLVKGQVLHYALAEQVLLDDAVQVCRRDAVVPHAVGLNAHAIRLSWVACYNASLSPSVFSTSTAAIGAARLGLFNSACPRFIPEVRETMTAAQRLHRHLVHQVFARASARDPELVRAVEHFDGGVSFVGDDLVFTLPQLYRFALHHFQVSGAGPDTTAQCDYASFRRLLYRSATNTELRGIGAVVVVECADDDHARSLYRLTRLTS